MKDRDRIIFWSILIVSIVLCFTGISLKPPHSDESGNGYFVNQIWQNGFFVYDPRNFHGPLLFYLFQISEKIFGFGIGSLRIVTALFSTLSVWLILKNRDLLGGNASFFAAGALALSPGISFFSRSAIHESLFVFFQILLVTGFLRTAERADNRAIVWSFAGLLGCVLLKETFVITLLSLCTAWAWTVFSPALLGRSSHAEQRRNGKTKGGAARKKGKKRAATVTEGTADLRVLEVRGMETAPKLKLSSHDDLFILKTFSVCFLIWLAFYTGFFHHWSGAADFFKALLPWLKTGVGGSGHDKPFYYWLRLMGRYEWASVLGLAGALPGVFHRSWKMRFFSVMALVNWSIYSAISYKTPWCIVSILWPFVVVAGLWFQLVLAQEGRRPVITWGTVGVVVLVVVQSSAASVRLNFMHYTDPSEPYVYVQTKNGVKEVEDIIRRKVLLSPEAMNMKIQINLKESWPFPWLFSRFPNASYGDYRKAFAEKGDVIFAELSHEDRDQEGLYLKRVIDVRDAREPIEVYLKKSVFQGMDLPGFGPSDAAGAKGK
jgi:uncharacterized protein (TIGR03663 family)